jgi:PAS domain S-box-containing protein
MNSCGSDFNSLDRGATGDTCFTPNSRSNEHLNYRSLFVNNPIPQALCQIDGTIVEVNLAFTKIFDRLRKNRCLQQVRLWEILLFTDRDRQELENLDISSQFCITKKYTDGDSNSITLQISGVKLELELEALILLNAIEFEEDRQNSFHLESQIQDSQRFLQTVFDAIPQRLFWKDKNLRYLGCNKIFALDAGLESPEQIVGKDDFELSWKESAHLYREDDRTVIETEISRINYEEPQVQDNGNILWLRTSKIPLRDRRGEIIGVFGSYEDISDRKQAQQQIKITKDFLENIINSASDPILVKNAEHRFAFVNNAFCKFIGHSKEELIGKSDYDFFPPKEVKVFLEKDELVMATEIENINEEYLTDGEGNVSILSTKKSCFKDSQGNKFLVGIIRDITEIKKTEEDLRQYQIDLQKLNQELESRVIERTAALSETLENLKATQKQLIETERMAMLGQLVAGVAHEINTPVGTSITVASTLKEETNLFAKAIQGGNIKRSTMQNYLETAQQCAQLIETNLHRAGELIQSFKQVAIDQNSLDVRHFQLKPYVEEILVSLEPKLKKTKHQVEVFGDASIAISSHPGAIAQIVTNLIVNSLMHAYQPEEEGLLKFEIKQETTRVILEYSDNGCGIPEQHLEKIFDPFFSTAKDRGGSGLGLHIIYNLVTQKLQGKIDVRTSLGWGTIFIISFPEKSYSNS